MLHCSIVFEFQYYTKKASVGVWNDRQLCSVAVNHEQVMEVLTAHPPSPGYSENHECAARSDQWQLQHIGLVIYLFINRMYHNWFTYLNALITQTKHLQG